jgi:outer membrane protein OmpA-like peptidoglycan-associated protein
MAKFCVQCGAALGENVRFCERCGKAVDNARPAVSTQASALPKAPPFAATHKRGTSTKILPIALGVIVFVMLSVIGSCVYLGYRVKKRASAITEAYKKHDATGLPNPAQKSPSGTSRSVGSPPISTNHVPKIVQVSGPETERTVSGPEADLLVRTGDINNLGFGWPQGFDPFSGESTPPHPFPWTPPPGSPPGTDRIMMGSAVTEQDERSHAHDGYSQLTHREDTMPQPITLAMGALPDKIDAVLFQIFVDDFQAPVFHAHFQVSLNGTRIPSFEAAVNSLEQTGPIGKLVSLRLLPEYWPLLRSGNVSLLIDDPTTHVPDGYAIDFVRVLVNPHSSKYQVTVQGSVLDAEKHTPIAGASVAAALESATTDRSGRCELRGLPAGLVVASANAPGYDEDSVSVDLVAGQTGKAEFKLHRHDEGTAALERSIAETGSARVYGIHFDSDSAKLRADSRPALDSILGLIKGKPGSRWAIAGHTDNQGGAEHNQPLSEARAASVVAWLVAHGVAAGQLVPQGFGASHPVADNATANGRAVNRRVEIAPLP